MHPVPTILCQGPETRGDRGNPNPSVGHGVHATQAHTARAMRSRCIGAFMTITVTHPSVLTHLALQTIFQENAILRQTCEAASEDSTTWLHIYIYICMRLRNRRALGMSTAWRCAGQGIVAFAQGVHDGLGYALKFFVDRASFLAERDMYRSQTLGSLLPQVRHLLGAFSTRRHNRLWISGDALAYSVVSLRKTSCYPEHMPCMYYTERATNAWHRQGTNQKKRTTTVNQKTSQTVRRAPPKEQPKRQVA